MSYFPQPDQYGTPISSNHLKSLPTIDTPFILKRAKGVYLYDIDHSKYVDFYCDEGNIYTGHSPAYLTKYLKNALSLGLQTMGFYHKFAYQSYKRWSQITSLPVIGTYSSILEMVLSVIHEYKIPIGSTIGCQSDTLIRLLSPFQDFFVFQKITEFSDKVSLVLLEEHDEYGENIEGPPFCPVLKIHSRFLYRTKKETLFEPQYLHFVMGSAFGGKKIGVLIGTRLFSPQYERTSFEDGILILEGAKLHSALKKSSLPRFSHPKCLSYEGWAICQEVLDPQFFLSRGIYIKGQIFYFSPLHSVHDIKRLSKALNEYFNLKPNDNLDQK